MHMKNTIFGCITAAALVTVGCNGNTNPEPTPDAGTQGFQQPADTVALNFSIDATQRAGEFKDGDLEWKGMFTYDKETRLLTYAQDWAGGNGPYAPLYDDGPWTAGGHEPEGATAGDNKFGITAFLPKQAEALTIKYGAQIAYGDKCTSTGGCWIWKGGDGSVTVPANSTTPVEVEGMTLDPVGTVDMRLTLDTNNLGSGRTLSGTAIKVKGTFSGWSEDAAYDDGTHGDQTAADGVFTYVLSAAERALLPHGAQVEFIWTLGTPENEYKTTSNAGETTGVTAATKGPQDTNWVSRTIFVTDGAYQNTAILVP